MLNLYKSWEPWKLELELKAHLLYYPIAVVMVGSLPRICIPLSEWRVVTGEWLFGSSQELHFPIPLGLRWRYMISSHEWNLAHITCWLRWLRSRYPSIFFPPSSSGWIKKKKPLCFWELWKHKIEEPGSWITTSKKVTDQLETLIHWYRSET